MTEKTDSQKRELAAHLGRAYLLGDKLPWDFEKAREHLEQAAAAGDPVSMGVLGYMQVMGLGGPANEARGYEWLNTAADMGEPGAHFGLAARYGQVGVDYDPTRSLGHFLVASKILGAPPGVEERLRAELTPDQIVKAECLAAEWSPARH
jgi:TPR repeat protein